jgi:very-short-patch-repair endonuclease
MNTGSFIWSYHSETPSERKLAAALRQEGLRFGQEVPVKGFTVDFLLDEWLVVEVDGETHLTKGQAEKDASRQRAIEAMGFTVVRVPAGDLGSVTGVKRWVKRIRERLKEGPPYRNPAKVPNSDYLRQIEEARKALRIGESERRKREELVYGGSSRREAGSGRRPPDIGESMEDYFGKKAEDFATLLDEHDWGRADAAARLKDEDDDAEKRDKAGNRHRPKRRRS